jgi:DNA-binding winged helix-turn-helix (wHTH) protein
MNQANFEIEMNAKWAPRHVALIDGAAARSARLRNRIEQDGYAPESFENSSELLALLCGGKRFDLVLLVEDGTAVWHQVVTVCSVLGIPALVLTGKSGLEQAAAWLHDFPVSPLFDFAFVDCQDAELHQRIARLLHHGEEHQIRSAKMKKAIFGNYEFHEGLGVVSHRGREVFLQQRQFDLALEFFRNVGSIMDRNTLWSLLWGKQFPPSKGRSLDVCVAAIRKKLELFPENGFALNSVYARGYRLSAVTPLNAAAPASALVPALESATAVRAPAGWSANSFSSLGQVSS